MIVVKNIKNYVLKIAETIAEQIKLKQKNDQHLVLGLATGSTPITLYDELVRLHEEENLSFHNVFTFNLDEYCGLEEDHVNSYHYFMNDKLFSRINIPSENIYIPNGKIESLFERDYCEGYEQTIKDLGGIDIQILGIGRNGHIGFNEPGSPSDSITRKVKLHDITRTDASPDFGGLDNVPTHAITMGMQTILSAKSIFLLAFGEAKKEITRTAINGDISDKVPASHLQKHKNVTVCTDFNIN